MLRAIRTGIHNVRKAVISRQDARCYQLLRKEYAEVNPGGVRRTVVIDKYKVAYNMVQKNGSSNLLVLWNAISSGSIASPAVALKKLRRLGTLRPAEIQKLDTYRWLLVVRNPYMRTLSAFVDKFRHEKFRKEFGNFDLTPDGFRRFVLWLEDGNISANDHWNLQMSQILLPIAHYSDIIRLENLDHDIRKFLGKAGIPHTGIDFKQVLRLGTSHKTGSDSKIAAFYNKSTQEKVYQLYQPDFLNLGYDASLEVSHEPASEHRNAQSTHPI